MAKSEITLRERLGGRWAISLRAFLISIPISITLAILASPEATTSFHNFTLWLATSIVAILAMGAVLLLADRTVLRNRRITPAPIWLVYIIDITAVEVRSIVYVGAISHFDISSSNPYEVRLLAGLLLGIVWFPALTYAFDSWERYSTTRDQLISHLVAEEIEILKQQQVIEVLRLGLIADINAQVDASVKSARESLSGLQDAVAQEHGGELAVATLSQINNDSIRQLSKELWNETASRSKLRLMDLMRANALTRPYRPVYFLIPIILTSITLLFRRIGLSDATSISAIWFSYISVVAVGTNHLAKKYPRRAFRIYIISIGLMSLSGLTTYVFLTRIGLDSLESAKWSLMASVTSAFLLPWFSSGSGIASHRSQVIHQLQKSIDQAEIRALAINGERVQLNKQISTYLHGTVQANMTAAIMRLQQSIGRGDREGASLALGDARKALDLEWNPSLGTEVPDLSLALDEIARGWKGFVEIDIAISGNVPTPLNAAIREIFIEAINNAVRHGESDKVEIEVTESGEVIDVCIRNNGHPLEVIETGLGTEVLNAYASGKWSRMTNSDGETILQVQLQK